MIQQVKKVFNNRVIQILLIFIFICIGVYFVYWCLGQKLTASELASWVQAIGSIGAIAVSFQIAKNGFDKAEARHTEEATKRETNKEEHRQESINQTERSALQLMVKAGEAATRLYADIYSPSSVPNVAFAAKGAFDAIAFGFKALDNQYLTSFDKFEQCINVLGACLALSEHTNDWGLKGKPPSSNSVVAGHCLMIEQSTTRFRELTGLPPLERHHSPTVVSAYRQGDGPVVHT